MPRRSAIVLLAMTLSWPAGALEVSRSIEIASPPKSVWQTIGGFCGIDDWHPAVEKCVLDQGTKPLRTLTLTGGRTVVEEQEALDDHAMSYSYRMLESALPVADYSATLSVAPSGEGSRVTWAGTFTARGVSDAEAEKTIGEIYAAGLKGLSEGGR